MAQDRPIEHIPTEMTIEEESVNTRTEQVRVFAKIFQEKIRDIATECTIKEGIYNGENKNIFTLELIKKILKEIKPKNSYGYDNIPMSRTIS